MTRPTAETRRRKIALALQGGGSHGAFTWGVLDRLLEDDTLEIIGVTGTSAGAMNAICLADGLIEGPEQARRKLRAFWEAIGRMPGVGSMLRWLPGETLAHMRIEQTPPYMMLDTIRRNFTPVEFNPLRTNPLRDLLVQLIDFDRLRRRKDRIVQVCATNVKTARRRVFSNEDISVDAIMASATLPDLFPAVEIDGQHYWDGGFSGNPAMTGLIRRLPKCDLIIVRIDPVIRKDIPKTARDIQDRVIELSFNTTFWMELSALGAILALVEEGELDRERFGRIFFHAIEASEHLEKIPHSTKLNNAQAFLDYLFDLGRITAARWLALHGADLGHRSTVDLTKLLPVSAEHPADAVKPRASAAVPAS